MTALTNIQRRWATGPGASRWLAHGLAIVLAGCASVRPAGGPPEPVAAQWHATLPHGGETVNLREWWSQWSDPVLQQLVQQAQQNNPTLAQATARIAQARAAAIVAGAARWPTLDANVGITRAGTRLPTTPGAQTTGSATLDAVWEIDLFGATRNAVAAALARAEGSVSAWHDLRVSVAAEVAGTYVTLRSCEAVLDVFEQDARSSAQTGNLTQKKVDAGLDAPANGALARAAAADSANRVVAQRAECDVAVKQLVALTAQPEPGVRSLLAAGRGRLPQPALFSIEAIPAALLSQRPDLALAERNIVAASADVGVAQADRYPRLSLTGSIGRAGVRLGGQNFDGNTWSLGAGLLAPLFDAGRRGSAVDAAQARYDEAVAAYRERAFAAVREVEEALVRLEAARLREADSQRAAQGYAEFLAASETQWRVGTLSLLDLEQARRNSLAATAGFIGVQRERVAAWLALYKAAGGGWQNDNPAAVAASSAASQPK
jgi:NodT family efflux transporter outer membrane factor (OMF) lipoprotein